MPRRLRRSLAAIAAAWFFASCIAPAAAETAPATGVQPSSGSEVLQEVVVTARKREEYVQNVPVAITALSGEDLRDQSVKTIANLQGEVPGLLLQQGADDPQSLTFTLRGRKQNDTALTVDPSVGLYVDGLYVPRTLGMAGSMLDIGRVEVLRGPQGTLYGRNTTGGAIALYTNNPTNELSGSVDVTGGNFGAWNLVGIANLPITDNIDARFVAQRGAHDGYGHNFNGDDLESEDSQYYRAKVRASFSDDWEALLSAHYESNRSGSAMLKLVGLTPQDAPVACGLVASLGFPNCPEGGLTTWETEAEKGLTEAQAISLLHSYINSGRSAFYDNGATQRGFSNIQRGDAGLTITGNLSARIQFKSISGFQDLSRNSFFPAPTPVDFFDGHSHTVDKYYSQEFQLLGSTSTLNWVVGLYGGREDGQDDSAVFSNPGISAEFGLPSSNVTIQNDGIVNSSLAGFAQATWQFVPDWHLTGGARYSHDMRRMDADNMTFGALGVIACDVPAPGLEITDGTPGTTQCPRRFSNTFSKPSWLVSLDHQLTADLLLYVKAAEGYRSGGQNESGSNTIESFASFAPETNVEYEAGVKSEFFEHRLRLNLDAYHDKYTDLQVTTAVATASGGFATPVTNAASATIQGVEFEAAAILAPGLSLKAWAAYTDAYYNRFMDATGDRTGEPYTVPKWTWSLNGKYVRPTGVGDLLLELDYLWRGSMDLDGAGVYRSQLTQSAVGVLNARLNLHLDRANMDVALFGKNITSEKYYDQAFQLEQIGINMLYATPPATYGIEVSKKFGK